MLQLRETRVVNTKHEPVATGIVIGEEGVVLAYVKEDGVTKVQPCTGVANEIFAGVALARNAPPASLPMVNEGVIAADGSFELGRAPQAGKLLVKVDGTAATIVTVAPAVGEVQVTGSTLMFPVADAGKQVFAQFIYVPSVIEASTIVGNIPAAGIPQTDTIGTLKEAQLGTNMFDAAADWSDALYVKLGPNGTFALGTVADHIPNAIVKNSPSPASPFLVVSINVA